MTAAVFQPSGSNLFSMFTGENRELYPARKESFVFALLGQAIVLALVIYLMSIVINHPPPGLGPLTRRIKDLPLVFSTGGGGGGGGLDPNPASHGDLPKASPVIQLAPPSAIVVNQNPLLPVTPTIVAPEIPMPSSSQLGDPNSAISKVLSNGRAGPGGIGDEGCCNGDGPGHGPGALGRYRIGIDGVTAPRVIFNPEPVFSSEARQSKTQGMVTLILFVDEIGRTRDIRVQQGLGMGLDEKAIEAVSRWKFQPAMRNGKPVPVQIAVEVSFRLY